MKAVLWRILLLLILLPPPSHPASSDSFPWSGDPNAQANQMGNKVHKDAYGAWRDNAMLPDTVSNVVPERPVRAIVTGAIAPGGTVSDSGVAQGNVGPTQSGPGAVGLFTPNSPGNAAAYDAQVSGGLVASPIVDGSGTNLRVVVPSATPSGVPNYHDASSGSNVPEASNSALNYNVTNGQISTAPFKKPSNPRSAAMADILSDVLDRRVNVSNEHAPRRTASFYIRNQPTSFAYHMKAAANTSTYANASENVNASTLEQLGQLTGIITYADNTIVLLGSKGSATIDQRGSMRLPDGTKVSIQSAGKSLRHVAQKNQLRL
ncbi:MAG: hypothetical protein JST44_01445 [Cyanobacteria bacterium SZAS LIN-5]|nr:hypothetical protein [Cyanobacteria bacterium SZAS LIN-5]